LVVEHTPFDNTCCLADEGYGYRNGNFLVQADSQKINVQNVTTNRVMLHSLQQGGAAQFRFTVYLQPNNGVLAAMSAKKPLKFRQIDPHTDRLLVAAIEDPRHDTGLAGTPGYTLATGLAMRRLERL
jgi:hypothetical protein